MLDYWHSNPAIPCTAPLFADVHGAVQRAKWVLSERSACGARGQRRWRQRRWSDASAMTRVRQRGGDAGAAARLRRSAGRRLKLIATDAGEEPVNHGLGLGGDRHTLDKGSAPRAEHPACD